MRECEGDSCVVLPINGDQFGLIDQMFNFEETTDLGAGWFARSGPAGKHVVVICDSTMGDNKHLLIFQSDYEWCRFKDRTEAVSIESMIADL